MGRGRARSGSTHHDAAKAEEDIINEIGAHLLNLLPAGVDGTVHRDGRLDVQFSYDPPQWH